MTPKLNFLCLSSTRWDYIWQRPQQLMSRIAEKHRVLFVDHVYPAANQEIFELLGDLSLLKQRVRSINENLSVFSLVELWPEAFKGILGPGDVEVLNIYIKSIFINYLLIELAWEESIIFTCLPNSLPLVKRIPHRLCCYDCVDDFASFSWWPEGTRAEEEKLLRAANIIFTTAQSLWERCRAFNSETYLIPNGADNGHFCRLIKPSLSLSNKFPQPLIGYIGALYEWVDVQLLLEIAECRPEWSILLIGPVHGVDLYRFSNHNNIYIVGPRDYSELPEYLSLIDVCIIPFLKNDLTINTNPIKMYEYLAAGKPVVSTDLPEVLPYSSVAHVAKSHQEFIDKIEIALHEKDLPAPLRLKLVNERRQVARENDWNARYEKILNIIEKFLK